MAALTYQSYTVRTALSRLRQHLTMGLASQLQQFQQQQAQQPQQGQSGSGLGQGAYPQQSAQGGTPQWQQSYPSAAPFQQGQNQQYPPAPSPSQSAFPSIQQGWQPGQQAGLPSQPGGYPPQQHAYPGQQGNSPGQQGSYPGQQGGYPDQQGNSLGQQGSYPGQQGGYPGQQGVNPNSQQGGYPGTTPQQSSAGPNQEYQGYVTAKLQQMVATNKLQAFYPQQRLQQVVNKVLQVDLRSIGSKWNMPMELAFDLCTLALYDIAIYADDSTSMKFAEGGERIKDLKAILSRVCEVATLFDEDGLTVRFMNSKLEGNNIKTSSAASALVDKVKFEGMTPLGTNLDAKIIQPLFTAMVQRKVLPKPVLVIVITDGEPTGEPADRVVQVIKNAKALATNSPYGPGSIAFEFAQVGKDAAAQAFLARLDKHPDIGKMIDATSYFELEQEEYKRKGVNLTPDVWLVKLMVGAVDPTFDEQD